MMVHQTAVRCDFSEDIFGDACATLKADPTDVTIFVGDRSRLKAFKLKKEFGCSVVIVPSELLAADFIWAVKSSSGMVWSQGV